MFQKQELQNQKKEMFKMNSCPWCDSLDIDFNEETKEGYCCNCHERFDEKK